MQGPTDELRDGGPRHPLPRPDHTGRLQRVVPVVQPWLLRLLRPDGEPNVPALRTQLAELGLDGVGIDRLLNTFNAGAFAEVDEGAST